MGGFLKFDRNSPIILMKELIEQLAAKYPLQIAKVSPIAEAELEVCLKEGVNFPAFSQNVQNHLLEMVDELTIVKVNILDHQGNIVDSFATNQ